MEEMIPVEVPTVEGASKFEQIATEAPSSVSIVTSDEIRRLGYRTLGAILESIRGFDITYDRNYSYVGVRGYGRPGDYNDKILLMIDGHRMNDNITNAALIGTEFSMDPDLIDHIEIIRGPGSSLYGNDAFFAVVDIHTRSGSVLKGTELSADAGSYDTLKGRISYGNEYANGLEGIVSGSVYHSRGESLYFPEYDTPSTNNGISAGHDGDQYKSAFMKLSWKGITFENSLNSRTKAIPTGSFGTDFNQANQTVDGLFYSDLKYEGKIGIDGEIMARLYYDDMSYSGDYYYSGVDNRDTESGERIGGELKYTGTLYDRLKIVLGSEYQDNIKQQQRNYDINPYSLFLDSTVKSEITALYFQGEFSVTREILVNAGVRYDQYQTFGNTVNPRLGLILNPFAKSFFKFLYGSAFRAPNAYELYYFSPGQEGNLNLNPETIKTYEAIYDQYYSSGFRSTVSAFYYKIDDLITQETDPLNGNLVFENVDQVETKGAEFEIARKQENGLEGRISYSYQIVKNAITGMNIPNSPKQLAKGNLLIPLCSKNLSLGIEELYTGEKLTLDGNITGAVFLTNLTVSSRDWLAEGLDASVSVYNLFDAQYSDPGRPEHLEDQIPQDGMNYRIKLTWRF